MKIAIAATLLATASAFSINKAAFTQVRADVGVLPDQALGAS